MKPLYITGHGSLSSLGATHEESIASYKTAPALATSREVNKDTAPVFALSSQSEEMLHSWLQSYDLGSSPFDRVTRLALYASSAAMQSAGWAPDVIKDSVVTLGTARGATATIEDTFTTFSSGKRISGATSPLTTLGGIASTVASFIGSDGMSFGTSMTCASFMQSLITSIAFLESGRASQSLVCGAEAPLTPYTIAQMKALRIYSTLQDKYPCRPLAESNATLSSMVLGEGAASFTIENSAGITKTRAKPIGVIRGVGFCRENNETPTGMEPHGEGLRASMARALEDAQMKSVDAIIVHAPGTRVGDSSELKAIDALFNTRPQLFSTKYLTGHTFGASAALSLELALFMLNDGLVPEFPYATSLSNSSQKTINSLLINSAGFGGVISSVLISRA